MVLTNCRMLIFGAALLTLERELCFESTTELAFWLLCSIKLSICVSISKARIHTDRTVFVCPIRLTLSSAWSASPGVQGLKTVDGIRVWIKKTAQTTWKWQVSHLSINIIVRAAVRVIPTPPAPNVAIKTGEIPSWKLSTIACLFEEGVSPARSSPAQPTFWSLRWTSFATETKYVNMTSDGSSSRIDFARDTVASTFANAAIWRSLEKAPRIASFPILVSPPGLEVLASYILAYVMRRFHE